MYHQKKDNINRVPYGKIHSTSTQNEEDMHDNESLVNEHAVIGFLDKLDSDKMNYFLWHKFIQERKAIKNQYQQRKRGCNDNSLTQIYIQINIINLPL